MNYNVLARVDYVNLLVQIIAAAEGMRPQASFPRNDPKATIGFGYTFSRTNNVALWQAAGISLSASELGALQAIDAAPANQRDNLAVTTLTRVITRTEAMDLLRQTYGQYEAPANDLGMPPSAERAALVAITYNRGVG